MTPEAIKELAHSIADAMPLERAISHQAMASALVDKHIFTYGYLPNADNLKEAISVALSLAERSGTDQALTLWTETERGPP